MKHWKLASIGVAAAVLFGVLFIGGIEQAQKTFSLGSLKKGLAKYHGDKTEVLFKAWAETWISPWFNSWNIEYLLPSISVPLLVMQGRDDQYGTPAQVDVIVAKSSGPATPLLLEDCGHSPHLDFPELTLDLMSCFVNRLTR